ncbi:TonB-dependent vitamin B12 receptor [Pseudomonas sp. MAP12]|uniref:TonB-dependent vitamin B12 receptor n=1 Tax=Geopseudomonas aromaticivorans TaxID=2849492 RepID=A0ABS6MVJ2_9GAMM|nr:TonB-dependent vitamin B12 receptor [Pseudomonas aromaticivorans]MBV2132834.1 TonB-dependent vitamin B12 receptor [Pseudomonas aromaticivorans]
MSKALLAPAAIMLCGVSSLSLAAEPLSVEPLLVTASRTVQTASESLAAVTVIDREEIERKQAASLPELLRSVPGVSLANNGGPGKSTSLFLRGSESDHVLVLIDGIKVGSATSGSAAFQDLPVELIERIEIVRGPRSSLYGSEAIGGVIQIFTRKDGGAGLRPFLSVGSGSHASHSGSAGLSGRAGFSWFNLGVSASDSDGINVKPRSASGYEDDRDGYRNLSASLRAGHRFANGLELDGNFLQAKSHNDYDGVNRRRSAGFGANADGVQKVAGLRARFAPLEPWQVTLQGGRSEDKSDADQDGAFYSRFDTRRDSLSWQNDVTLAEDHTLVLGVDHQHDEVNGSTAYAEDSRDNDGYFAQYLGGSGRHDWQLALRRDDNQQFGDHETGSLAWGYALSDSLRAYASYGTAFKAPTFNELYYPGYGNPELDAETSRSLELGLQGRPGWGHWQLAAFRTLIDDLIAYDASLEAPNNVDQARIRGVEASLGSQWLGWDWNANLTLQEPESRGGSHDGNELARRAKQMLNLDIDRAIGRFSVGASLHAEDQRYDDLANQSELSGYASLDLRGEYCLDDEWRLQARVTNLLDADYQTAAGYNQPGQAVYFTVRYQAL